MRFFSILGKFSFRIHGQGRQEGVPIISEFICGHGFLCYKFVIEVINNTIGAETSELLTNHLSKFLSFFYAQFPATCVARFTPDDSDLSEVTVQRLSSELYTSISNDQNPRLGPS